MKSVAQPSLALVSNALLEPADEGIRRFAWSIARRLVESSPSMMVVDATGSWLSRKLLLGREVAGKLRAGKPDVIIYIPTQPLTIGTYVRSMNIRMMTGARVLLIASQAGSPLRGEKIWARLARPALLLTPSPGLVRRASRAGVRAEFMPMGIDLERFRLGDHREKANLREKLGIEAGGKPVILHVGHLREARNLRWLVELNASLDVTIVVVAGTSRGTDVGVLENLLQAGIQVVSRFLDDISEVYRAADCYAFPVTEDRGSIAVPLSVLEAMGCNLPVVTTPFGGLPSMFSERDGFFFGKGMDDWIRKIDIALHLPHSDITTRDLVRPYEWTTIARSLEMKALELCS